MLKKLFVGVALLLVLAVLGFVWWLQRSLPQTPPRLHGGVGAEVTISYDHRRRPYVRAESWRDAFFAQGWLHANERLWQMELLRRAASGRLAEVFGAAMLGTDVQLVTVGVPELARNIATHTSGATRDLVDAYVRGVNANLEARSGLPPEFALLDSAPLPWQPADVFGMAALMAWQSGNNMSRELLRLALLQGLRTELTARNPGLTRAQFDTWQAVLYPLDAQVADYPYILPPQNAAPLLEQAALSNARRQSLLTAPEFGSNGWVVSPARSATGHALFAFDSHDGFSLPNLTYDVHLFVRDAQIRGASVPGLLGVINGFNEFMAWGFTNIGDSQDLFIEEIDAGDTLRIKGRNGWYRPRREQILIPVRGESPHLVEVVFTENGRLWSRSPPLSLRWSALEAPTPNLDALVELNRAVSYAAFEAALDNFAAPSANATYADRSGRIAFRTAGVLPVRGTGQGLVPQSGSDPHSAWRDLIPVAAMPRLENPDAGYIAAANARVQAGPPLISADNAPGYRMTRIRQMLGAATRLQVADMRRLQTDWFNQQAARVLPLMLRDVAVDPADPQAAAVLADLRLWAADPVNAPDAREPLWFAAWYRQLGITLFEPMLGAALTSELLGEAYVFNAAVDRVLLDGGSPWWQGRRGDLLYLALRRALDEVGVRALWQDRHGVLLRHELSTAVPLLRHLLNSGPHPWGGGNATVGRARYNYQQPFVATGGATVRMVIEMSAPLQAYTISPGGQSGHFLSRHYDDQTPQWLAGELDTLAATPEDIGRVSTTILPLP